MEPDGVDALRADVRAQMASYARRCAPTTCAPRSAARAACPTWRPRTGSRAAWWTRRWRARTAASISARARAAVSPTGANRSRGRRAGGGEAGRDGRRVRRVRRAAEVARDARVQQAEHDRGGRVEAQPHVEHRRARLLVLGHARGAQDERHADGRRAPRRRALERRHGVGRAEVDARNVRVAAAGSAQHRAALAVRVVPYGEKHPGHDANCTTVYCTRAAGWAVSSTAGVSARSFVDVVHNAPATTLRPWILMRTWSPSISSTIVAYSSTIIFARTRGGACAHGTRGRNR